MIKPQTVSIRLDAWMWDRLKREAVGEDRRGPSAQVRAILRLWWAMQDERGLES